MQTTSFLPSLCDINSLLKTFLLINPHLSFPILTSLTSHSSFQKLSVRYDEEARAREEAEQTLRSFRKDVDDAAAVRLDLERRVESLMDEISFLRKVHDEEIQELSSMMEAQQVSVELELAKPDLTSALKEIRNQYESIASKNLQSAEEWYKSKFASLSEQATRSNEAMRASREEISEFRRQLQSKTIEIETLRGANESLERQITEMEDAHNAEVTAMQVRNQSHEKEQRIFTYWDKPEEHKLSSMLRSALLCPDLLQGSNYKKTDVLIYLWWFLADFQTHTCIYIFCKFHFVWSSSSQEIPLQPPCCFD